MNSKTDALVAGLVRGFDCTADVAVVLFVRMHGIAPNVGAVYGKTGNDFAKRVARLSRVKSRELRCCSEIRSRRRESTLSSLDIDTCITRRLLS